MCQLSMAVMASPAWAPAVAARGLVLAHAGPRVVRRQHQPDRPGDALVGQRGHGVLDERRCVLLAEHHGEAAGPAGLEGVGQRPALRLGALGQRRDPPDGFVAPDQVGQLLGARRSAPPDVGVVGLDVGRRPGGAVGHDHHPGAGLTPAPSASSAEVAPVDQLHDAAQHGRVGVGRDAVAQVEDVAAAMAGALGHDPPDLGLDHRPGGEAQRRVEVALHGPTRSHAPARLVEGHPPVDAHHVGPRLGHLAQQLAGVDPEVDAGDVQVGQPRRRCGRCGGRRTPA